MKRLVTALAGVGLMLALTPPALAPAAVNNATSLTAPARRHTAGNVRPAQLPPRDRQLRLHRRRRPQDR